MNDPTKVFVIGASAGGVEALTSLVRQLPHNFPGAVFVVLHIMPTGQSALPTILSRSGPLPAIHPADRAPIEAGKIYIAPPDFQLMLEPGRIRVMRGPRENRFRPAADVLFRTAALAYGDRTVGIVLSGTLDDGTLGLQIIKRAGGVAIVQDPDDAAFPGMPRSAMEFVDVDYTLPVAEMSDLLVDIAYRNIDRAAVPDESTVSDSNERRATASAESRSESGLIFSCPECGGVMQEDKTGGISHYRCRVGHAYSGSSLLTSQHDILEQALWTALRVLDERVRLVERLIDRAERHGNSMLISRFRDQIREAELHAESISRVLLSDQHGPTPDGVSSINEVDDVGADEIGRDVP